MKYLKIYRRLLSAALMKSMAYPDDFILWFTVDIAWTVVNIGFFRALLWIIPEISGWSFAELSLPLGILYLLNFFIWGFMYGNMKRIPRQINTGEMDFYLTKPIDSQFLTSSHHLGLGVFPSLAGGIILLNYGFSANNLPLSAVIFIPISLITAVIISYSVWFMTVTLAFWFNRLLDIPDLFAHSVDIARYPSAIFHPVFRFLFTYILPFALLGFLPAEIILGRKSPLMLFLPIALAAILLYLSHLFWNFSLRRYQSASS